MWYLQNYTHKGVHHHDTLFIIIMWEPVTAGWQNKLLPACPYSAYNHMPMQCLHSKHSSVFCIKSNKYSSRTGGRGWSITQHWQSDWWSPKLNVSVILWVLPLKPITNLPTDADFHKLQTASLNPGLCTMLTNVWQSPMITYISAPKPGFKDWEKRGTPWWTVGWFYIFIQKV